MDRLLEFAEAELTEVGPAKFNLVNVLERAGVSRSSAYHHFGDRDGVIAAVEMKNHVDSMRRVNELLRFTVENSTDPMTVLRSIEFHLSTEGGENGRSVRRRRVYTLSAAQSIPALAGRLSEEQRSVADYLAETIAIARERGFIAPVAGDLAIAHAVLALMFGRVLVDVADRAGDDEAWFDATAEALRHLLNVQSFT